MILKNFAVLEGCDGSGTSTQLDLLKRRFERGKSPPLFCTAEPTGGPVGRLIRSILGKEEAVLGETLARLFAADRAEHLYAPDGIVERCKRGELVVSDRYTPSSLVYQTIALHTARGEIVDGLPEKLNASFPLPELLIYLDIESETAIQRISGRSRQELFEELEFQKMVREGYRRLIPVWEKAGVRTAVIDGSKKPEEAAEEVWRAAAEMPILKKEV